jgi:hypothetical protein
MLHLRSNECLQVVSLKYLYTTHVTLFTKATSQSAIRCTLMIFTIASCKKHSLEQVQAVERWGNWAGVEFVIQKIQPGIAISKCATLAIEYVNDRLHMLNPKFSINGLEIPSMQYNDFYKDLGTNTTLPFFYSSISDGGLVPVATAQMIKVLTSDDPLVRQM